MKRLIAALFVMALIVNTAMAEDWGEVLWTEHPNGYIHFYEDCILLSQESVYPLVQGTTEQAQSAGKNTICIPCAVRKFHGVSADPQTVSQYLLSGWSDSEVQYYAALCAAELERRHPEPITLYPGVYVAGQDIPAGAYRMEMINGQNVYAAVYRSQEEYAADSRVALFDKMFIKYTEETIAGRVQLDMGNVLYLQGTFQLTPFTGAN